MIIRRRVPIVHLPLMKIERFFVQGLAHASYVLSSEGEAAIIDPERQGYGYLDYLVKHQLRLVGIFLTHLHADFVAGHAELAAQTGAPIYLSQKTPATFKHLDLPDFIRIGTVELQVIETPGHSPDSVCYCVVDNDKPVALFSGDTLFVSDVGRPDLWDRKIGSEELAGMLYDSLFNKLIKLPAETKVYPAHGAGSLCGRQISSSPFTTIGQEIATNWALQLVDRRKFVETMITNLPERPSYFARSVEINSRGAPFLSELDVLSRLALADFGAKRTGDITLLDVRPAVLFGEAHPVGALNIGITSPSFATWCGFFLSPGRPIVLVVEHESEASRARLELARIGFDQIAGFLLADDLEETAQITQIAARDLLLSLKDSKHLIILDVRSISEWNHNHLDEAIHIPLPHLPRQLKNLSPHAPVAVLCQSGYRSSIATSLLESEGFTQVSNVMGGMHAIYQVKYPKIPFMESCDTIPNWVI